MDPAQNFTDNKENGFINFFNPSSIALVGATEKEGSVGRTLLENLLSGGFKGKIYPVNPKRDKILSLPCFPSLLEIKEPVDLAVIITPAHTVPELIDACGLKKIPCAIIISAGFKELGSEGLDLENKVLASAKKGGVRIIGPNCLGVMSPLHNMNATFAASMAHKGKVAFLSQSGAMCTAVLDWSLQKNIGFSAFISIGSMADVNWGDLINYLGNDPETESILLYMETIGDAHSFLSAAREVALTKPIIVIKPGKSAEAAAAAASHTGSLAGSDAIFDAAMQRAGVLRVSTIKELFDMALVLALQPLPKGPNLTLITNAGGPGVLTTDACIAAGCSLAKIDPKTVEALNAFLPNAWSHTNPVDILGDASADLYKKTIEIVAKDGASDGILVILSPQSVTDATKTAEALVACKPLIKDKPLIASWMGGLEVKEGREILQKGGIPCFNYPDSAAAAFGKMWEYKQSLNTLYAIPEIRHTFGNMQKSKALCKNLLDKVKEEGRLQLTEAESKEMLEAYGIPIVKTLLAKTVDEAVSAALALTFPVVLKLDSKTITHKSDVGGVKLGIKDAEGVKKAFEEIKDAVKEFPGAFEGVSVQQMAPSKGYELILGSHVDVQFGKVILFGFGGTLVEIFKDSALGLPPLNGALARELMKKTKIYQALLGVRGEKSVDMKRLEEILVSFSKMMTDFPEIAECDINPLRVSSDSLLALDARIILQKEPAVSVIRPYPEEYITEKNGVQLRPILAEDEPLVIAFHKKLSESSVKKRYLSLLSLDARIQHQRLIKICHVDYARVLPLVAISNTGELMGVCRLEKEGTGADITMVVADVYQGKGIGRMLFEEIIKIASLEEIKVLRLAVSKENDQMIHLCKSLEFKEGKKDGDIIHFEKNT